MWEYYRKYRCTSISNSSSSSSMSSSCSSLSSIKSKKKTSFSFLFFLAIYSSSLLLPFAMISVLFWSSFTVMSIHHEVVIGGIVRAGGVNTPYGFPTIQPDSSPIRSSSVSSSSSSSASSSASSTSFFVPSPGAARPVVAGGTSGTSTNTVPISTSSSSSTSSHPMNHHNFMYSPHMGVGGASTNGFSSEAPIAFHSDKFHVNVRFAPRDMFTMVPSCIHSRGQVEITNTHKKAVIVIRSMNIVSSSSTSSSSSLSTSHPEKGNTNSENSPSSFSKHHPQPSSPPPSQQQQQHVHGRFHTFISRGKLIGSSSSSLPVLSVNEIQSWFHSITVSSSTSSYPDKNRTDVWNDPMNPATTYSNSSTNGLPIFLEPSQSATIHITYYPELLGTTEWLVSSGIIDPPAPPFSSSSSHSHSSNSTNSTNEQPPKKITLLSRMIAEDYLKFIMGESFAHAISITSIRPGNHSTLLTNPVLLLETSVGTLDVPMGSMMKATRFNPFHLPHSILFFQNGFVMTSDSFFDNHHFPLDPYEDPTQWKTSDAHGSRSWKPGPQPRDKLPQDSYTIQHWIERRVRQLRYTGALYEYDIYMNNPYSDKEIQIQQVWITYSSEPKIHSLDILSSFGGYEQPQEDSITREDERGEGKNTKRRNASHQSKVPKGSASNHRSHHNPEQQQEDEDLSGNLPSIHSLRFNNCGPSLVEIDFCNTPKSHKFFDTTSSSNSREMANKAFTIIPAGAVRAYVRTIRWENSSTMGSETEEPNASKTESGMSPSDSRVLMGYYHMRTNVGDFSIALEEAPGFSSSRNHTTTLEYADDYTNAKSSNDQNHRSTPPSPPSAVSDTTRVSACCDTDSTTSIIKQDSKRFVKNDEKKGRARTYTQQYPNPFPSGDFHFYTRVDSTYRNNHGISVSPDFVDFGSISHPTHWKNSSKHQQPKEASLAVMNNLNVPVRIVRFSVLVQRAAEFNSGRFSARKKENYSSNDADIADSSTLFFGTIKNNNGTNFVLNTSAEESVNSSLSIVVKVDDRVRNGASIQPGDTMVGGITLIPVAPAELIHLYGKYADGPRSYRGSILVWLAPLSIDYREFKTSLVDDPNIISNYLVEVPFTATIFYGHIEYALEDIYFPVNQMVHRRFEDRSGRGSTETDDGYNDIAGQKSLIRTLYFTNNFSTKVRVKSFRIRGLAHIDDENDNSNMLSGDESYHTTEFCSQHFHLLDKVDSRCNYVEGGCNVAKRGQTWKGMMLRFYFLLNEVDDASLFRKQCTLTLETDVAGTFDIPIMFYSGRLDVELEDNAITTTCPSSQKGLRTGTRQCLQTWWENIFGGIVLNSSKTKLNGIYNLLFRNFFVLNDSPSDRHAYEEDIILLSLGGVRHDEVTTSSFVLVNMNPFSLSITASTSAMEGMEIRLGAVTSIFGDSSNNIPSYAQGNPENIATNVRNNFAELFSAKQSRLDSPLDNQSVGFETVLDRSDSDENPSIIDDDAYKPMIVSLDGSIKKRLKTINKARWTIPPGARARFDLTVRSPPKQMLAGGPITSFVTKGIFLKTNVGQVFPVVVKYDVLYDRVVIRSGYEEAIRKTRDLEVLPARFLIGPSRFDTFINYTDVISPIVIEHAFPDQIILKSVESCSKWFEIVLNSTYQRKQSQQLETTEGGELAASHLHGIMHSITSCAEVVNRSFPNFFQCAIELLENPRQSICGESRHEGNETLRLNTVVKMKEIESYMEKRYSRYVHRSNGSKLSKRDPEGLVSLPSFVSKDLVDMFHSMAKLWSEVKRLKLNHVSGRVRANLEVRQNENLQNKTLSMTISRPALTTIIDIPRIFDPRDGFPAIVSGEENILRFNITKISGISKAFIPVRNPSGFPLHIRLLASTAETVDTSDTGSHSYFVSSVAEERVFVPITVNEKNPWWTNNLFVLKDPTSGLFISKHSNATSTVSSHVPTSFAISALVHKQCGGYRCGHSESAMKEVHNYTDTNRFSPIGASAALGQTLRGHFYRYDGYEDPLSTIYSRESFGSYFPPFGLGADSAREIVIPPFGTAKLGPIFFRPPSRHIFNGFVFIENSLTGLESVRLEGKGGLEKLVLLDSVSSSSDGESLETRYGMQAYLFPGSSEGYHGAVVKTLYLANVGDTSIKFTDVYFSQAFASSPRVDDFRTQYSDKCQERGFRILGCYDESYRNKLAQASIFSWLITKTTHMKVTAGSFSQMLAEILSKFHQSNGSNILHGFTLHPGDSRIIHISHTPDCIFRSFYASLTFEYHEIDSDSQTYEEEKGFTDKNDKLSILVGYEREAMNFVRCVPALDSLQTLRFVPTYDKNGSIGLKSLIIQYIRYRFFGKGLFELIAKLIPFILFTLIVADVIRGSRERCIRSSTYKNKLSKHAPFVGVLTDVLLDKEANTAYHVTHDPDTTADLIQMSKDLTKKGLLDKFKAAGMLHPHCIGSNGTFLKQRHLVGFSASMKGSSLPSNATNLQSSGLRRQSPAPGITLSDLIFCRSTFCKSESTSAMATLPHGLGWREAIHRGIITSSIHRQNKKAFRVSRLLCQRRQSRQNIILQNVGKSDVASDTGPFGIANDYSREKHIPTFAVQQNTDCSVQCQTVDIDSRSIAPHAVVKGSFRDDLLGKIDRFTNISSDIKDGPLLQQKLSYEIKETNVTDSMIHLSEAHSNNSDVFDQINAPTSENESIQNKNTVELLPLGMQETESTYDTISEPENKPIRRRPTEQTVRPLKLNADRAGQHRHTTKLKRSEMQQNYLEASVVGSVESSGDLCEQDRSISLEGLLANVKQNEVSSLSGPPPLVRASTPSSSESAVGLLSHNENSGIMTEFKGIYTLSDIDSKSPTSLTPRRPPPGLSPPPGFSFNVDRIELASTTTSEPINSEIAQANIWSGNVCTGSSIENDSNHPGQSHDPLGAALSQFGWKGTDSIFTNSLSGHQQIAAEEISYATGDINQSMGATMRSQSIISEQIHVPDDHSNRPLQTAVGYGLGLEIQDILNFLNETVDEDCDSDTIPQDVRKNTLPISEDSREFFAYGNYRPNPWSSVSSIPYSGNHEPAHMLEPSLPSDLLARRFLNEELLDYQSD